MGRESDAPEAHVYRTRVRSHQTDLNAAMYHGAYFDVFDDARIEVFRRLGYTYQQALDNGWSPIIRRVEAEFRAPARMDDEIEVDVRVSRLRPATMVIEYDCRRAGTLLAHAAITYAFVDETGRPLRMPADLRHLVQERLLHSSD